MEQVLDSTIKFNPAPDVSVVIVSLNTLPYLRQAIENVSLGFKRHTAEIIVVDNGSKDGSVEYVSALPNVRLIANKENRGFAQANNQAFEIMRGTHCFLLNSDAFLHESCGDLLVDFMLEHPQVGLVVPTFEYLDGRWQPSFGTFPSIWESAQAVLGIEHLAYLYHATMDHWARGVVRPQRVDYGEGAGLLIHYEVLHSMGGFSSDYFCYSDDLDYGLRAAKAGWQTWWVPQARLTHIRGGSLTRKDYQAALQTKVHSFIVFLACNYPAKEARITYILRCLCIQRMYWAVHFLSLFPFIRQKLNYRLEEYRIAKDVYWRYFPRKRFDALMHDLLCEE